MGITVDSHFLVG